MAEFAAHSTFGLGTIAWGTKLRGDDLDSLYDSFREAGQNFFDSAHVYSFWLPGGSGASERALGDIVRHRGDRANVVLATKGGHPAMNGGYDRPERYLSPQVIARDVADSLDRLGVDAIDLYFLHRDDPRVPVGEIVDLLNEHVGSGRLREIGASNWTSARIEEANGYAAARGLRAFVASQVKFSLATANPGKDPIVPPFDTTEIAWHQRSGLPVCAYSPTAAGGFAAGEMKGGWINPPSLARLAVAKQIAAEIGASAHQVALAWLLQQEFTVIPLLGTTNVEHLRDALAAGAIRLSADQMCALTGDRLRPPP
jgi:aryl-alcohol dehydrogenase-like predicted oxidoreductase